MLGSFTAPDAGINPNAPGLKNRPIQNVSEILSRLLLQGLSQETSSRILHTICDGPTDKFLLKDVVAMFWSYRVCDELEMSSAPRAQATMFSTRRPLIHSSLRLGYEIQIDDRRLLPPLLQDAVIAYPVHTDGTPIPRLRNRRAGDALRAASGCRILPRLNSCDQDAFLRFIDTIMQARFVLVGSPHAVTTAAACHLPFGIRDGDVIDLPFAWKGFTAFISIRCMPYVRLEEAEVQFDREIVLTPYPHPPSPMLMAALVPIRPEILKRDEMDILKFTVRSEATVLPADVAWRSKRPEDHFRAGMNRTPAGDHLGIERTADIVKSYMGTTFLNEDKSSRNVSNLGMRRLEHIIGHQERNVRSLNQMVHRQALALEQLQLRAAKPAVQTISPDVQLLRGHLRMLQINHDMITQSTVWRIGQRLRDVAIRHPRVTLRARQTVRLAWWIVSLRLANRLRQRRRFHRDLATLQGSPLFDATWYRIRHEDRIPPGVDPLMHYMWIGVRDDLDPHPLFDARWYRSQMECGSTANPLVHYLFSMNRHDPHPLFDTRYYLTQLADGLPVGQTPLEHHLEHGDGGPQPNEIFDAAIYLYEYPQATDHVGGAFRHYIEHGEAAGLAPHPLFDPTWYASRYPDRGELGPLAHYLRQGRLAGHAGSAVMQTLGGRLGSLPLHLVFPAVEIPEITIIVPTHGRLHETIRCLAAVMVNTGDLSYEVLVVDDRPDVPIAHLLHGENLRVLCNAESLGVLRSCNAAAKRARGQKLVFLNSDTMVGVDWLRPMVALVDGDRHVGMVGCKLLNTDGTLQEAGGIIHSSGRVFPHGAGDDPSRGAYSYIREVDVVGSDCFLVRRDLFEQLNGFDDRYISASYKGFDLATGLRDLGYKVLYQPASTVIRHGGASYGTDVRDRQLEASHAKFCAKWCTLLAAQPAEGDPLFLTRERPSPRGTILVIDDKVPEQGEYSDTVTLYQYLELMCELGLKVIFAPQDLQPLQPHTEALQRLGIEVVHAPETLFGWLRRHGRHLDYVWTARPDVTFPILDLIKRTTGAPILYYTHGLGHVHEMRRHEVDGPIGTFEEVPRLKPMELDILAAVDHVMTPSREEAEIIAAEVPEARVTVLPPYLFRHTATDDARLDLVDRFEIIFVGEFDHMPDVDAARWLILEIMPLVWMRRPEARVMIVGKAPPPDLNELSGPRVDITGLMPTFDPYYRRARVAIGSPRRGAGVTGRIVSALQAGVPVVTTAGGNEGIQLRHGTQALTGNTPDEIADAIVMLLEDDRLSRDLATAGLEAARTRFSTERARSVLLGVLGDDLCPVCGTRPRQPRIAGHSHWREAMSCVICLAPNGSAALAEVIVSFYRRQRVTSLREALPLLRDLRIHEFGPAGPVTGELSKLPGFTSSDVLQGRSSGSSGSGRPRCQDRHNLSFDDASVDLMISQDAVEHVPGLEHAFMELFRVLRVGGRHVFTISGSTALPHTAVMGSEVRRIMPPDAGLALDEVREDLMGMLRAIGFAATMHSIGNEENAARRVLVIEATKLR